MPVSIEFFNAAPRRHWRWRATDSVWLGAGEWPRAAAGTQSRVRRVFINLPFK